MNDLEAKLRKLRVETAPETLDHRVAKTLQTRPTARRHALSTRIPLWASLAACIACFAGGMLFQSDAPVEPTTTHSDAPPPPVEFVFEASPEFAAFFAPEEPPDDFFLRKLRQTSPLNSK